MQKKIMSVSLISLFSLAFYSDIQSHSRPSSDSCASADVCNPCHEKFKDCNEPMFIFSKDVNRNGRGLTINKPGNYVFCEDIVFHPRGNKPRAAITITSPNVTVNLASHTLSQGTAPGAAPLANVSGIVGNNLSSVHIMNGSITDFTGAAIRIENSTAITVENLNILRTGVPSSFGGLQINDSSDIVIGQIKAFNNFGCGMYLHGVIKVTVSNSSFSDNVGGNVAPQFFFGSGLVCSGGYIDSSPNTTTSDVLVQDCSFNQNSAGSDAGGLEIGVYALLPVNNVTVLRSEFLSNFQMGQSSTFNDASGLVLVLVNDYVIQNCVCSGQRHPFPQGGLDAVSGATGFSINACNNGVIENCQAFDNVGEGFTSIGIRARGGNNLVLKNCECSGNINTGSGQAFGFYTDPDDFPSVFPIFQSIGNAYVFDSCVAQQNTSATGLAGGFKIANLSCSTIQNCIGQENAIGIVVTDSNSPQIAVQNIFKANIVQCNTMSGINDRVPSANNAYLENIARSNGPAGSANYVGLPVGTPIVTWNMANPFPVVSNPFVNLSIIP